MTDLPFVTRLILGTTKDTVPTISAPQDTRGHTAFRQARSRTLEHLGLAHEGVWSLDGELERKLRDASCGSLVLLGCMPLCLSAFARRHRHKVARQLNRRFRNPMSA